MRLRPLARDDLPAVATIAAASFFDDEFFVWICPHRREYPDAYRRWWLERTRKRWMMPGVWGIVCVEGEKEAEVIVGYALWRRISNKSPPSSSAYLQKNKDLLSRLEQILLAIQEPYYFHVLRNPATDHAVEGMFRAPPSVGPGIFDRLQERWQLFSLAVAPGHQRKGIGQTLVQWGLDRCREEAPLIGGRALPATLVSSPAGQCLYSKMGFSVVAWFGEGTSMMGGAAMAWDENSTWTRPVTAQDGVVLKGGRPVEALFREESSEREMGFAKEAAAANEITEANAVITGAIDEAEKGAVTEVLRESSM